MGLQHAYNHLNLKEYCISVMCPGKPTNRWRVVEVCYVRYSPWHYGVAYDTPCNLSEEEGWNLALNSGVSV